MIEKLKNKILTKYIEIVSEVEFLELLSNM